MVKHTDVSSVHAKTNTTTITTTATAAVATMAGPSVVASEVLTYDNLIFILMLVNNITCDSLWG
ncbi:hypothetical protein VPNG_05774 [Cytospora leucostoma]|uniref:Uncharacterized protein n=1 Tax=Cytospora leucostoma TaxID=1230097 RepID=A0A423X071_9PEZI|nr:hypothetical protein VPNG_05774 [Cytospora leucostoma]